MAQIFHVACIQNCAEREMAPSITALEPLVRGAAGEGAKLIVLPELVNSGYVFETRREAFDLAEEFQTPVFVMSDLDLGMNNWMADGFDYPSKPMARGKVLSAEDLDRLGGFDRYKDVDGDGIGYRTLPGTKHPKAGFLTRGSGHNEQAIYSERPEVYVGNMDRLAHKFETARSRLPKPEIQDAKGAEVGVLAYGTTHWAIVEALDQLRKEQGVTAGYCRVRAFPISLEVFDFIHRHRRVYVVEQNRDAQMLSLLRMEVDAADAGRLRSVLHYNGLPVDARSVTDAIVAQEARN